MAFTPANATLRGEDELLWQEYRKSPTAENRRRLLDRFAGVINGQVNKWAGPVSRDVLLNEARLLAVRAFDSWNPAGGASLATWLTNQLMPLSRTVYTYQNSARMPESVTQRTAAYNRAVDAMKHTLGREPTTDELHSELGWSAAEINRVRGYNRADLVESGPTVTGSFFARPRDDEDDVILGAVYMELSPQEKQLFECVTGYNGVTPMNNAALMKRFGMSQAQVSYRKAELKKKIEALMQRPGIRARGL